MNKKTPFPSGGGRAALIFNFLSRMRVYLASVGEEVFELIAALVVMILVERYYGQQGLGIYAYLTACLYAARYLANYGVAQHAGREVSAHGDNRTKQDEIFFKGHQAVIWTGVAAAVAVIATAFFDTGHTRIEERVGGYFIIALTIPVSNSNFLKLSVLHGLGRHNQVARLRMMRYGFLVGAVFVLCNIGLAPSFLLLAVLASDLFLQPSLRKLLPGTPLKVIFSGWRGLITILKRGQAYLFCDDGLTLLLNIDLFVLGLFVSSWDLGVYAEAAVLVRFFLVIPAAVKPIFKQQYTALAAHSLMADLARTVRRRTVVLFSLHALLALWILLFFPIVLNLFFRTRGEILLSCQIFTIIVPGLIYFSALCAQEPLLEALGQAERLKRVTLQVAVVNLLLSFYLVPFAGPKGAAAATMLTMLLYFGLFGKDLPQRFRIRKFDYAVAGCSVYVVYMLLKQWGAVGPGFWVAPVLLGMLFYLGGLYGAARSRRTILRKPIKEKRSQNSNALTS